MAAFININETSKNLKEYVAEVGAVQMMMQKRLLDLVRLQQEQHMEMFLPQRQQQSQAPTSNAGRNLEQFVKEIASVEAILRAQLLKLIQEVENERKREQEEKETIQAQLKQLSEAHQKMQHENVTLQEEIELLKVPRQPRRVECVDAPELLESYRTLSKEHEALQKNFASLQKFSQQEKEAKAALLIQCDHLDKFYQQFSQHHQTTMEECERVKAQNEAILREREELVLEKEMWKRRLATALQYFQMSRQQEAAAATASTAGHVHAATGAAAASAALPEWPAGHLYPNTQLGAVLQGMHFYGDIPQTQPPLVALESNRSGSTDQDVTVDSISRSSKEGEEENDDDNDVKIDNAAVNSFYEYHCPAHATRGCQRTFAFARNLDPPLNRQGEVCDQAPWDHDKFCHQITLIRQHMKVCHPTLPADEWPPGFARPAELVPAKRKQSRPVHALPNATKRAKTALPQQQQQQQHQPAKQLTSEKSNQIEFWGYPCPAPGCRATFEIAKWLRPPVRKGKVLDTEEWPLERLAEAITAVQDHLREEHPTFGAKHWPKAFRLSREKFQHDEETATRRRRNDVKRIAQDGEKPHQRNDEEEEEKEVEEEKGANEGNYDEEEDDSDGDNADSDNESVLVI